METLLQAASSYTTLRKLTRETPYRSWKHLYTARVATVCKGIWFSMTTTAIAAHQPFKLMKVQLGNYNQVGRDVVKSIV
ncbi:hypothetical protein JG688_00015121 [Phytophthora aleatoria]|uniref:Uncharacterized protein n=1 Tax=Phytophthora aleatoria TaxID=2496075 RepID=A0A8J5M2W4_9STRA|nr:hypothetical protein JG688_00015121 [Phytophthora aleatoria]